jgi:hypothetical protein
LNPSPSIWNSWPIRYGVSQGGRSLALSGLFLLSQVANVVGLLLGAIATTENRTASICALGLVNTGTPDDRLALPTLLSDSDAIHSFPAKVFISLFH